MIAKISKYIVNNFLVDENETDEEHKEILLFGLTRILEDIPKFAAIIFICYLLNILPELLIVFLVTILYKVFIGGAHAKTNIQCFLVSLIYFIVPIMLAKYLNYSNILLYIIYISIIIFSLFVIYKYAPADTEEIPIINKKKRINMQILAYISIIIISLSLFTIVDKNVGKIIIYTVFLANVFTLPLTYRLLGCKLGSESEEYREYY